MPSKDYFEGDERITVDRPSDDGGEFVTLTRYEKGPRGRYKFVESVCIGLDVWEQILKDGRA